MNAYRKIKFYTTRQLAAHTLFLASMFLGIVFSLIALS
jgi:hypothetical protein